MSTESYEKQTTFRTHFEIQIVKSVSVLDWGSSGQQNSELNNITEMVEAWEKKRMSFSVLSLLHVSRYVSNATTMSTYKLVHLTVLLLELEFSQFFGKMMIAVGYPLAPSRQMPFEKDFDNFANWNQ